jgi:hypothetical protein
MESQTALYPASSLNAIDGESLFVEQLLDAQHAFHIAAAVHALSGAAFYRLELGKFAFPEAQYIGRQPAQRGDFADAEIKFVGDEYFIRFILACTFFSRAHFFMGEVSGSMLGIVTQPATDKKNFAYTKGRWCGMTSKLNHDLR